MTATLRLAPVSAIVGLTMMLAACSSDPVPAVGGGGASPDAPSTAGGDDSAPTPAATDSPDDAVAQNETGDTSTVYGTATVGDVEYELHELRRCEPSDAEQIDRELELTARGFVPAGEGHDGGDWVQLDVSVQQVAGMDLDQVSWAGPEGVFGTDADAGVSYEGDRVSGTANMVDSLTLEGALSVTYDLEVPDEILDCRP